MKTLVLNGSPRVSGDTVSLIKLITSGIKGDTKIVNAYYCGISPCIDCRYCWKHSGCSINDEQAVKGVNDIIEFLNSTDKK